MGMTTLESTPGLGERAGQSREVRELLRVAAPASRGARISKLEPRCKVAPAGHAGALAPCSAWHVSPR